MHPVLGTMMPEVCEDPHLTFWTLRRSQIVGMRSSHSPSLTKTSRYCQPANRSKLKDRKSSSFPWTIKFPLAWFFLRFLTTNRLLTKNQFLYARQRMQATDERQENATRSGSPVARRSRPGLIGITYPILRPARLVPLNAMYIFVCAVGVVTARRSRSCGVSPR